MKLTLCLIACLIVFPFAVIAFVILPFALAVEAARWLIGCERRKLVRERDELKEHLDVALQQVWQVQRQLEASDKAVVTAAIAVRDAEQRVGGRQFQTEQNWSEQ